MNHLTRQLPRILLAGLCLSLSFQPLNGQSLNSQGDTCSSPEEDVKDKGDVPSKRETASVTAVELGDTKPVHQVGPILLAGQPAPSDFKTLAKQGYSLVITLRGPDENTWDERQVVESAGMRFVELPIVGLDDLNDNLFKRCCELLDQAEEGKRVCLHCASASRVGAVWMVYRVLNEKVPLEQARSEASRVGLRSRALENKAVEYLQQRNGQ